ncbi:hypothetical protein AB4490_24470 [Vibrio cyclitrophicus]
MEASTIDFLNMLGTWFSGIGAFSAVLYAMTVNRPKLKAKLSKVGFSDDGDFSIDLYNSKPITAHISYVRLVKSSFINFKTPSPYRFKQRSLFVDQISAESERLVVEVRPGEHHRFNLSAKSILNAYCELSNIKKPKGMQRMVRAKIAIYLSNGSVCYAQLPKSIYQKLKNVMYTPISREVDGLLSSNDKSICTRTLDSHDEAMRRHHYLVLPFGINDTHFYSNE